MDKPATHNQRAGCHRPESIDTDLEVGAEAIKWMTGTFENTDSLLLLVNTRRRQE